jgi:hypothetical protein
MIIAKVHRRSIQLWKLSKLLSSSLLLLMQFYFSFFHPTSLSLLWLLWSCLVVNACYMGVVVSILMGRKIENYFPRFMSTLRKDDAWKMYDFIVLQQWHRFVFITSEWNAISFSAIIVWCYRVYARVEQQERKTIIINKFNRGEEEIKTHLIDN